MVKELDDPGGGRAGRSCSTCAPQAIPRNGAGLEGFELAVAAAGALAERAHADARRVRLVLAGGEGEPASATERLAVRRLLARARAGGERSPGRARRGACSPPSASR